MLGPIIVRRTIIIALVFFFQLSIYNEVKMTEASIANVISNIYTNTNFLKDRWHVPTLERSIMRRNHALITKAFPKASAFGRQLEENSGNDDDKGNLDYYGNETWRYSNYGFDISLYSLKYASCSAITTFSDDRAADGSAAYEMAQYVVFRLCPSDQCSKSDLYGCSYDYGEYMIPLGDWLTIMSNYRAEEFERYCKYCEVCMTDKYYKRERYNDAVNNGDVSTKGYYNSTGIDHTCTYYNNCINYTSVCNTDDDGAGFNDFSNFFSCIGYDLDDDGQSKFYLGPHCSKKKGIIEIGVFSDEYCSDYTGNMSDVESLIDMVSIDLSDYYKSDCISCQESSLAYKQTDEDTEDEDNISEVCEDLYNTAAKCNRHIGVATDESYNSYQQEDNEYTVCSFINSVVTGVYDEYGLIYLNINQYRRDNQQNEFVRYGHKVQELTFWQFVGIFVLASVCFMLMLWSCFLRRAIDQKISKQNQEEPNALAVQQLSRQNSGIIMCRSKSFNSSTNGMMV